MTKKIPKLLLIFAIIATSIIMLVLISYVCCCFTPDFTGQLVDANGKSIQGAFVIIFYKTDTPNPGGRGENAFASGVLETDQNGQFHIPSRFHCFIPLLESKPCPVVELAYSAKTHSCVSRGDFYEDFNDSEMNVHRVTMPDLTDNLQLRAWALQSLIDTLEFQIFDQPFVIHLRAAPGVNQRLMSTLHSEYNLLSPKLFSEGPPTKGHYLTPSNFVASLNFSMRQRQFRSLSTEIDLCEMKLK